MVPPLNSSPQGAMPARSRDGVEIATGKEIVKDEAWDLVLTEP